jgi:hypothetical protein
MDKKIIIFILLVAAVNVIWGESKAVHKKRTIKIKSVNDQITIGYETSNAIIYFGKEDVLNQLGKIIESKNSEPKLDYQLMIELKSTIDTINKVSKEIIVPDWHNQIKPIDLRKYELAGMIDQWILRPLILKGKTKILNKNTNAFENHIIYNFLRDQLGAESCFYTFSNGTEFYGQIITLGE